MLLRHKKTHGEEQNWCVILAPLKNDFDKKKVAHKISEIFSLSSEESSDLVSNTPIILLDNLTKHIALQVQDYFRGLGAEMKLTNDVLQKRKCYRTVWPDPPNLSFLHQWQPAETPSLGEDSTQALAPDQAVHEIRSINIPREFPEPTPLKFSDFSKSDKDRLSSETEKLRRECQLLRDQVRNYQEEILRAEDTARLARQQETQSVSQEKEKEMKELRILLSHAEEKYQVLHEEYREARGLYEDKIGHLAKELEQWKNRFQNGEDLLRASQAEKQSWADNLAQKDALLAKLRDEQTKDAQAFEQKFQAALQQSDSLSLRIKDMTEKVSFLQRNKEQLETSVNEQSEKIASFSTKYQALLAEKEVLKKRLDEELSLREQTQQQRGELFQKNEQLLAELESRNAEIKNFQLKTLELEKHFQEVQEAYQNQDQIFQANLKQLEHREKELENARKQLREINYQLEQRETTQRRTRIAAELTEKETFLKRLVSDQEKIEAEIRDREESIRRIIADQEKIEKEIMEGKQAQRHLAEIAKRDNRPRFQTGKDGDDAGLSFPPAKA